MSRKPKVIAAGGVVVRNHNGEHQVLLIHRKSYNDWSLPKGKRQSDELLPETAHREILEETGVDARLDLRLGTIRYTVSKGPKATHYWRGNVVRQKPRRPDHEVSVVKWFKVSDALKQVSYPDEREIISEALEAPTSNVLLMVRHGKAMLRKDWTGPDQKRRLTSRGRHQAKGLIGLLGIFGVERLVSSSATRCMETLEPYARASKLTVQPVDLLTEEEGTEHPGRVRRFMHDLALDTAVPTAICGHRPVLPSMYQGLGLEPRPMVVGEALALHLGPDGQQLRCEVIKPTS